jgi:hypothetical protein
MAQRPGGGMDGTARLALTGEVALLVAALEDDELLELAGELRLRARLRRDGGGRLDDSQADVPGVSRTRR